jgi:peptidylprolyl isomerase
MAQAKTGDTVAVHYTGKLEDGTIFDSSKKERSCCGEKNCEDECGATPLKFKIGNRELIPGFEEAVIGMSPGDTSTITIPCEKAYGPVQEKLIFKVERNRVPENVNPKIGDILKFENQDKDGKPVGIMALSVIGITNTHLTLDGNHPLAGRDLTFEIELIEII